MNNKNIKVKHPDEPMIDYDSDNGITVHIPSEEILRAQALKFSRLAKWLKENSNSDINTWHDARARIINQSWIDASKGVKPDMSLSDARREYHHLMNSYYDSLEKE